MYNELAMRRLINHTPELFKDFESLKIEGDKFGKIALKQMYDNLDPKYLDKYNSFALPDHFIVDTPITKVIDSLVKMYGWGRVMDDLQLYAQNREQKLREVGLREAGDYWQKIRAKLSAVPKSPKI